MALARSERSHRLRRQFDQIIGRFVILETFGNLDANDWQALAASKLLAGFN